ncbi:MAG: hypothetical protein WD845_11475 [Pirellulales bacterium]
MTSQSLLPSPRFRLRTLLVLVAGLGVAAALASRPVWIVRQRNAALAELEGTYWASAAFDTRTWGQVARGRLIVVRPGDPAARIGALRRWLGDRHVNEVLLPRQMPPADSELLAAFPEATFYGRPGPTGSHVAKQAVEIGS